MREKGIINHCFSKIQIVAEKINMETKQLQLAKRNSAAIVLVFKARAFHY